MSHAVTQNQKEGWSGVRRSPSIYLFATNHVQAVYLILPLANEGTGWGWVGLSHVSIRLQDLNVPWCWLHWPQQVPQARIWAVITGNNRVCISDSFPSSVFLFLSIYHRVLFPLLFSFFQISKCGGKTHQSRDGKWKSSRSGQISKQCGKAKKLNASEIHW